MIGLGDDRLSIYLNDHLAGATVGVELARRTAASNRSATQGPALAAIAREIEEDRQALLQIMQRFSVRPNSVKVVLSWGAEKVGRLKLNGELMRYSPLSRLEELEGLSLGVEGKLALWQALKLTHGGDDRLNGIDLDELIKRARSQRRRLESQRRKAAGQALG